MCEVLGSTRSTKKKLNKQNNKSPLAGIGDSSVVELEGSVSIVAHHERTYTHIPTLLAYIGNVSDR
jgi:hypothetical protein